MFQVTKKELRQYCRETGFLSNPLEKSLRLIDILETFNKNPVLKGKFVLKGGSALNLFIFNTPRLSIDIDLNYIGELELESMRTDRVNISQEILNIFQRNYSIEIGKDKHALTQFLLRYKTLSGSKDLLKIEINYLHRQPLLPPINKKCKLIRSDIFFPCLTLTELTAGKIIALLSRYTARDLFDIFQVANYAKSNKLIHLSSILIYYAIISSDSVFDLFHLKFNRLKQSDIRNDLVPMLKNRIYYDLPHLVQNVTAFIKPLMEFSDGERIALTDFYKTGELQSDVMFSEDVIKFAVKKSPALRWKIQNIKGNL